MHEKNLQYFIGALKERNRVEYEPFIEIFEDYNKYALINDPIVSQVPSTPIDNNCANKELEDKIILLENLIANKEQIIKDLNAQIIVLKANLNRINKAFEDLEESNRFIKDEQQALQLAFDNLQLKYVTCRDENNELLERWLRIKSQDIDRMNMENENYRRKIINDMSTQLIEAAREASHIDTVIDVPQKLNVPSAILPSIPLLTNSIIPTQLFFEANAHDGEVFALDTKATFFATGSMDRKVKVWELTKDGCQLKCELIGSSGAITSVSFNHDGSHVLSSSNDFACRIWSLNDQRIKHTLTGHSAKVLSAKYLDCTSQKIVSASYDRTLKIWDLNRKSCIKTYFAGSSCTDVAVYEEHGSIILSTHLDKNLRVWDLRLSSGSSSSSLSSSLNINYPICTLAFPDKLTGLDISNDKKQILVVCRDHTVHNLDLRYLLNASASTQQTTPMLEDLSAKLLKDDQLQISYDWVKACYSPDANLIGCGSSQGNTVIWDIHQNQNHIINLAHGASVLNCKWNETGTHFITCFSNKKIAIWI